MWLQDAGYNTYYTGKLFNAHSVENYDKPHAKGWTISDFALDPYTYNYKNTTYQRNHDPPVSYEGNHTTDVLTAKSYGLLDEAVKAGSPFFLGIAPVAPHSNLVVRSGQDMNNSSDFSKIEVTPPIPADRHKDLFKDAKVPRTPNFNPDQPSGANWIRARKQLTEENIEFNDHFYRERLRSLQSVDELLDGLVKKLDAYGLLDNTYIFYTTDNGYHLSQHRLQPGKECSFEEDINIPLLVRGPGVPKGETSEIVTTHTDLAPTFLGLAGAPLKASFDGIPVPLTREGLEEAERARHEHVTVEFWGIAAFEAVRDFEDSLVVPNNTYKAVRIISDSYNLLYTVWCTNEHELYDLNVSTNPPHCPLFVHLPFGPKADMVFVHSPTPTKCTTSCTTTRKPLHRRRS